MTEDAAVHTSVPSARRPSRLVYDWKAAHDRAIAYLDALGVPQEDREPLAAAAVQHAFDAAWAPGGHAIGETLRALRTLLVPDASTTGPTGFRAWRLRRLLGDRTPATDPDEALIDPMPGIRRRPMVHETVHRSLLRRLFGRDRAERERTRPVIRSFDGRSLREMRRHLPWVRAAHRRRLLLILLVLIPTVIASAYMVNVLPHQGRTWMEVAIVACFGALFGWISIGFWTALMGFVVLVRGRDRFAITALDDAPGTEPPAEEPLADPRTAIIMPICAEPVERVFAGLRAIHRSLEGAGALEQVHFYVLSDTADPALVVKEELAWLDWCRDSGGFGRIFYRNRKARIARKSGNVADFCRRVGSRYRYMITLDADSVMSGRTIARLIELMDRHPTVGLIQTAPQAVNRRSLFARIQQFASHIYSPMFAAGLQWWQLGDGQYWGHNTIIRIGAFMAHCGLPRLPGREPLGGEILSHDFVEAALMGRAGWGIWLAYDLDGSWEEVPSTLLEEMKRDRRWCQGNLQHVRLLFTEGLFGAHRMLFLNGALSYVSALLWFAFLGLSTVEAIRNVLAPPDYFPNGPSLFPDWPVWRPDWAMALMGVIAMVLFLPKVLSILLVAVRPKVARGFGGVIRVTLGVLLEIVTSSLLAPIRMVFHSRFVVTNLLGRTVGWKSQGRDEADTGWGEALRHHGADTVIASAWGAVLYWLNPSYFWWVTPIIGALFLSVPVSVLTSRVSLGDFARRLGLFLIPEERDPPPELADLAVLHARFQAHAAAVPPMERDGFVQAVVDPLVNAFHRALLRRPRRRRSDVRATYEAAADAALRFGPDGITMRERRLLLHDPELAEALHERVWALPDDELTAQWGRPGVAAGE